MPSIYLKWLLLPLLFNAVLSSAVWLLLSHQSFPELPFKALALSPLSFMITLLVMQNLIVLPALYWFDKRQSKRPHKERVPELVLHAFSIFGGALGAILGQRWARHKTLKVSFTITNIIGLVCLVSLLWLYWSSMR